MPQLTIKLNNQWARFSREHAHLEFLGTVEQQASIGALARSADGAYWQVNGDVERKLNTSRVQAALRAAGHSPKRQGVAPKLSLSRSASQAPAPTVIVKRRRVVAIPPSP
ncbi:MAG TPA: hypothetical protein VLA16_15640 [Ideonella sp.]|nr:hypothetical protein [Ideonella sp.]